MADGATDAGGTENETVFCRFVQDGRPVNRLIGHKAVEHAHSEGDKLMLVFDKNSHSKSMLIYWYTFICSGDDQYLIE